MSPRRLKWTGLTCLVLSLLTAGAGFLVQIGLVLVLVLFHAIVLVPIEAGGGAVEPVTVAVPRILPATLFVAGLLMAVAVACLVESSRRRRALNTHA